MMIHRRGLRPSVLLAAAALSASCSASADTPLVERTDSAGITIVRNLGGDRPLDWTFEQVLRLGGADAGPESFYRLGEPLIGTDARGQIFVLDAPNHRVVVFDSAGRHVRSFGHEGAGPGEMERPVAMAVEPSGAVTIAELLRPGLARWDSVGNPVSESIPLRPLAGQVPRPFDVVDGSVVAVLAAPGPDGGGFERQLVWARSADTTLLATARMPKLAMVDLGCVGMDMTPRYTPDLVWGADQRRVAVTSTAAYDVHLHEAGRESRIRRDVVPREVTREMVLRDIGDGITVNFGGAAPPCKVSAETLVERQGYEPVLPVVGAIALSTDGSIWVRRRSIEGQPRPIDVFAGDGAYLGTLPPDSPFPVAFTPGGDVLTVETDELDLNHLVVYRVLRPDAP